MTDALIRRRLLLAGLSSPILGATPALAAVQKTAVTKKGSPPAAPSPGSLPEDRVLGDPKAKVTVVEYASVGCPICAEWGKRVWPAFKARYVDSGKVRFVYREMLVGGPEEQAAAAAGFVLARCAAPEKYFDVVEALYRDQEAVFRSARPALLNVAKGAGLTEAQFGACLANDAAFNALYKRTELNAKTGRVNATPTFVINGKALEPGFQELKVLDAAIAKA